MANGETRDLLSDLTKLDGRNYALWKYGIEFLLEAKNLTGFVDGSKPEPNKEKNVAEWNKWKMLTSQTAVLLLSSVEKSIHGELIDCKTPQSIWHKLTDLYDISRQDTAERWLQEFSNFSFQDAEQAIAPQIERFDNICKKLRDAGETLTDDAMIRQLLNCLPQKFSAFRIEWNCMPKNEKKKDHFLVQLIREDKRLTETERSAKMCSHLLAAFAELKKTVNDIESKVDDCKEALDNLDDF